MVRGSGPARRGGSDALGKEHTHDDPPPRPLTGSYPAAVALVVFSLVPFLLLTGAVLPLAPLISKSLHLSTATLDIAIGLSDAGYALGTVLAVQFAVHLPARRMLLGYVSAFLVAAVLAAWAPNGGGLAALAMFLGGGARLNTPAR